MTKKRIRAAFLCVLMIGSLLMMCACQNQSPDVTDSTSPSDGASGEVAYKVTVVDGVGAPYTEKLIVKFMQADQQIAMLPIGKDGSVEKVMPKGDYTVQVMSTDTEAKLFYDDTAAKLTAEQTELQLLVAMEKGETFETISAASVIDGGEASYDAYYLEVGTTHTTLDAKDRNYFLFVPQEAGTYEVSVVGDAATLGVYGGSVHFVMGSSTHEMTDGKLSLSVQPSMIGTGETGTTVYVLGIDVAEGVSEGLINIVRVGEPGWSFTEEPWSNYQPTQEVVDYTLPEGTELTTFDLTASTDTYQLVYNEADGCYHVGAADGPKVFVQLGEAVNGISLMGMVGEIVYQDGVLMQTGSAPFRYSYDNGQEDFFKEDYTDAMREYVTARDKASGVYPLNKDLYYMLPLGVQANGWCREDTANFLFRDLEGYNPEIGWMFLLLREDLPIPGSQTTDPTEPSTEPTEPVTEPTDPVTEPTTPVVKPTDPVVEPTDPIQSTKPTQTVPPTQATKPTEPTACSHQYGDAGCTTGKVCKLCGETTGSAPGHDFNAKGKCSRCSQKVVEDNKSEPTLIASTLEFDVDVKAGHMQYFEIMRVSGTTLRIKADGAFVIYKKKIYKAEDGVVKVPDLQSDNINSPVELAIGNNGPDDLKTNVTMSYPSGTLMNPKQLNMGSFTTKISAGNDQGVYYSYRASSSGTLTISLDEVSGGADIGITLYNETTGEYMALESMSSDTVSVQASKGDVIQIIISTLPDSDHKYPAATVMTTASFN